MVQLEKVPDIHLMQDLSLNFEQVYESSMQDEVSNMLENPASEEFTPQEAMLLASLSPPTGQVSSIHSVPALSPFVIIFYPSQASPD